MSQDEEKEILRTADIAHAVMKSLKALNTHTEQMTLSASKKNPSTIDVDKLVESCNRMEALIEAERLQRAKRLEEIATQKTDLNKGIDELENLVKYGQKSREDWLNAGMPLKKPLKVKKPLTLNKKPGK